MRLYFGKRSNPWPHCATGPSFKVSNVLLRMARARALRGKNFLELFRSLGVKSSTLVKKSRFCFEFTAIKSDEQWVGTIGRTPKAAVIAGFKLLILLHEKKSANCSPSIRKASKESSKTV